MGMANNLPARLSSVPESALPAAAPAPMRLPALSGASLGSSSGTLGGSNNAAAADLARTACLDELKVSVPNTPHAPDGVVGVAMSDEQLKLLQSGFGWLSDRRFAASFDAEDAAGARDENQVRAIQLLAEHCGLTKPAALSLPLPTDQPADGADAEGADAMQTEEPSENVAAEPGRESDEEENAEGKHAHFYSNLVTYESSVESESQVEMPRTFSDTFNVQDVLEFANIEGNLDGRLSSRTSITSQSDELMGSIPDDHVMWAVREERSKSAKRKEKQAKAKAKANKKGKRKADKHKDKPKDDVCEEQNTFGRHAVKFRNELGYRTPTTGLAKIDKAEAQDKDKREVRLFMNGSEPGNFRFNVGSSKKMTFQELLPSPRKQSATPSPRFASNSKAKPDEKESTAAVAVGCEESAKYSTADGDEGMKTLGLAGRPEWSAKMPQSKNSPQ